MVYKGGYHLILPGWLFNLVSESLSLFLSGKQERVLLASLVLEFAGFTLILRYSTKLMNVDSTLILVQQDYKIVVKDVEGGKLIVQN